MMEKLKNVFVLALIFCSYSDGLNADGENAPLEMIGQIEIAISGANKQALERHLAKRVYVLSADAEGADFYFDLAKKRTSIIKTPGGQKSFGLFKIIFDSNDLNRAEIKSRSATDILRTDYSRDIVWDEKADLVNYPVSNTFVEYCSPEKDDGVRIHFKKFKQKWLISAFQFRERGNKWASVCMSAFKQ